MEENKAFEENKERAVFQKFMDVKHIMRAAHHRKMAQGGPACDPTRGRGRILTLLKLKDGVATKDMAQILGIRVSSLNETLAKLEKDGLIERTPSEEDKRVMLVSLTEAGRAQAQPAGRFPARMFEGFSEDELAAFEGYLDRITANLEADLGEDAQEYLQNMREARETFMKCGPQNFPGPRGPHGPHDYGPHGGRCGHGPGEFGPHGPHDGGCEHGPHGEGEGPRGPHGGGCGHGPHGPHHHHHPHGCGHGPGEFGPHGHGPHVHGPHGGHCGHGPHGPHFHHHPHGFGHGEGHGPHGHGCCRHHGHHGFGHGPHGHGCCHR